MSETTRRLGTTHGAREDLEAFCEVESSICEERCSPAFARHDDDGFLLDVEHTPTVDGMDTCPQHVELEQGLACLAEAVVEKFEATLKKGRDGEEMGTGEKDRGVCAAFFGICIETKYKENE